MIDSKEYDYYTPYFTVTNYYYESEEGKYLDNDGKILFNGNKALLYSYLPKNEDKKYSIDYQLNSDIIIKNFEIKDFVDFDSFTLNDQSVNSKEKNNELKKGNDYVISSTLKYKNGVSDKNIVRTSTILKYSDGNSDRILIDWSGIYIFPDYANYGAIKSYIDSL